MDRFFSIVIPTYNRVDLLPRAIDSIIAQEYPYWECIIVDDHSTDCTLEMLKQYEQEHRIRVVTNNHRKGASGARNTGLGLTKNDWVLFFDSDNKMHPDLLKVINASISDDCDVCVYHANVIDAKTGDVLGVFDPKVCGDVEDEIWTERIYIDTNNAVIRKNKLIEIGGWDELCPSMEEWDLHLRLSAFSCYSIVPKVLVDYYTGISGSISSNWKNGLDCRLYLLQKHKSSWKKNKEAGILNIREIDRLAGANLTVFGRFFIRFRTMMIVPSLFGLYLWRGVKNVF